jgi:hypothetical protein
MAGRRALLLQNLLCIRLGCEVSFHLIFPLHNLAHMACGGSGIGAGFMGLAVHLEE